MLFLAFRYLLSRKRQTALILTGIVLGTTAYVAISGMMLGFQEFIADQLINNDAHIRITAREEPLNEHDLDTVLFGKNEVVKWMIPPSGRRDDARIAYPLGWFERLDSDPRVLAHSPQLNIQTLARRGKISISVRLIGSDPARQAKVTNIEKYMTIGNFSEIGVSGNRIIVGDELLRRLGARVGETLLISSTTSAPTSFKVIGAFHVGIHSLDNSTMFGALADVQRVNATPSQISDIAIKIRDVKLAKLISESWSSVSPDKVESWDQANASILSVFKTQDIVRNSMTISILLVAGFGIYNILSMLVSQKRQEIAILRSVGYESRDVMNLFFVQGLVLGTLGGIIGVILGYFICRYMSTITVTPGRMSMGGKMMVSFDGLIYVRAFILAFASSTVAAILPARAASKLDPIEIIRSGG